MSFAGGEPTMTRGDGAAAAPAAGGVAAPVVSLPKGGGAIRGIGEKFGANPVTGTGSMTVPIPVSPGRSGFGPDLTLTYDSGAGNGPFGFGWMLTLPSITRKTDKGLPRYRDAEESDVFILSGTEDLVPVVGAGGDRFEDTDTVDGYTIHRYRPRIEGLFARIERWTRDDGDVHWRSISRDNVLSVYGKNENSRIADPADSSRVFTWLVCEMRDDRGNAVVYAYKAEDGTGADRHAPHQRHRGGRDAAARAANRYLKSVRYGNRVPLLDGDGQRPRTLTAQQEQNAGWMFEVVLDYGEHDRHAPRPDNAGDWDHRGDAFSSYRSAFEVRTARLCRRVLMFHHFPAEAGLGDDCLVRSTDLDHAPMADPVAVDQPTYTFLRGVEQAGYRRQGVGYLRRALPPVEFEYTRAVVDDAVYDADSGSVAELPAGVDGTRYRWVDLHGDGVAGVLTEQAGALFYKRNVSPVSEQQVELAPWARIDEAKPNASLDGGQAMLMDLAGDGQLDLVTLDGPVPGLYEQDGADGWRPFRPFTSRLARHSRDPNMRLVDLTGDGLADALITEDEALVWHESLGEDGFGPAQRALNELDEERGPRVVFADRSESIHLADLSGDGLTDLVRIRNGEICYWPNLGYGRFGAKVTMDHAPAFDRPDQFEPGRLRLADIDGSGTTDVVYLHADGPRLYFNQSGNSWSHPHDLDLFPPVTGDVEDVTVTDLLGNGTSCLVWSSPLPGDRGRQLRYVKLMGAQKPHLLTRVANNLGTETLVRYVSSTKFRLRDEREGRPWITRLPFPVHVVERAEVYDRVGRNRFVTRYAYHHGYFDGDEREFRGFAMVEQWDTETMAALAESDAFPAGDNVDTASHVPPVHVKNWFHTGAPVAIDTSEYYREPGVTDAQARARLLDDTVLPAGEEREARRALKGMLLRREVYASDRSPEAAHPYTVMEHSYGLRRLQPRGDGRRAVFLPHQLESLTYHYERNPSDPRVSHAMTLEVDDRGNVLKEAAIGYGRRQPDAALPLQADRDVQGRTLVTYTEQRVTDAVEEFDGYRAPLPCESTRYELTGYTATGPGGRFAAGDFVEPDPAAPGRVRHVFDDTLAHEEGPSAGLERRVIGQTRVLFRRDDMTALLPLGLLHSLALTGESYTLALTAGLLGQVYERGGQPVLPADPADVLEGGGADRAGYVAGDAMAGAGLFPGGDPAGQWWMPSGRIFLSPGSADAAAQERAEARAHFFLSRRYRSPFHTGAGSTESTVAYDDYDLLFIETGDAAGNRVTVGERQPNGARDPAVAGNDYRVLQPQRITDPNGNRTQVAFDALGMVVCTAVRGKRGQSEGDTLTGFDADPPENDLLDHLDAPLADPHALLGRASTRLIYDLHAYRRTRDDSEPQPVVAHTISREMHDADLGQGETTEVQLNFAYSDGFGREIQTKVRAEPEQPGGPPRWTASGWTIFNNKGQPVRQYLPFFTDTHRFEFGVESGVSGVVFYDPVERVVATIHPNHTFEKTVFDAWKQETWDANDTVLRDPRTDPDTAGFVERYFDALPDGWQTWHAERQGAGVDAQERAAAVKTEAHASTPTIAHFDSLARPFLTVADNGPNLAVPGQKQLFVARVEFDIQGRQTAVRDPVEQAGDPRGRIVMRTVYDLLGGRIREQSMEGGTRRTVIDVGGKAVRAWDDRGHAYVHEYDALRRPLRTLVTGADQADPARQVLTERVIYGEQHPDAAARNLRGMVYLHLDHAGALANEQHDFKGNVLRGSRRFADDYHAVADWSAADATLPTHATTAIDPATLEAAVAPLLEADTYENATTYDALNRQLLVTTPHSAAMQASTLRYTYNEAGLLQSVDVNLHGAQAGGAPVWMPFVADVDYDAQGRRTTIAYGNGATTEYDYDPRTLRLSGLLTRRQGVAGDCPDPPVPGWPGCHLQNVEYAYDPVGNPTGIRDRAQQAVFFRNRRVEPGSVYTYDPVYRLVEATGREHLGQAGGAPIPHSSSDAPRVGIDWAANDGNAMGTYTETYRYDSAGNIEEMRHRGTDPVHAGWSRTYTYAEKSLTEDGTGGTLLKRSNRLTSTTNGTTVAQVTERYLHDAHGNVVRLPHLGGVHPVPNVDWDHRDQIRRSDLGGGGEAYYVYDAAGRRVRKVWEKAPGLVEERIYFGGFEIFRRRQGANRLERETLHVIDDQGRVATVETRTVDTAGNDPAPAQLVRYQIGDHLGTVGLEMDGGAQVISYEEYTPYGSTVYQAVRSATETPRRYRYTGKERDEETGLLYHGARYYAPWLGRWTACDRLPKLNRYQYARGSPVRLFDPDGKDESEGLARFWGGIRALGGAAQVLLGGAALLVPEPTTVTKVVGTIAVVNGTDDFMTGWRQMISGRQEHGAIEMTVTITAEAAGMEPQNAQALGTGTSMALGFVSPSGPLSGGGRGMAMATAGVSRTERVVQTASETPRIVQEVRHAQLASAITRGGHNMMMSANGDGESSSGNSSSSSSSSSSGGLSSSGGEPNTCQVPDEYFDDAMRSIDQGNLQPSGAHLDDLTSHAQSSAARAERGIPAASGQSAHISARSAMRNVAGYDPRAALTRLLDSTAHRGFDDYWKAVFRSMARTSGESTITVREYFNVMRDAIGNNPHFSNAEANSMLELLRDELFVQHGLRDDDLLRLPYSQ